MENLKGKTAFITGGASGIGLAVAKACGKEGMNVVLADLRQSAIDEAMPIFLENNWPALGIELDITDRVAYEKAVDEAEAKFGNIHLLMNNAGLGGPNSPFWEISYAETDLSLDVNLTAVLTGIQIVVPRMLKHGEESHIVSTASKAALVAVPRNGMYNLTKQALVAMMETLAIDLEGTNIGSSVFCPGPFLTNFGANSNEIKAKTLGDERVKPPPPRMSANMDDYTNLQRPADEAGERVVRGVKRGDLYIFTHSEFKNSFEARVNAMLRAFPDETPNERFCEVFSFLLGTAAFDKQESVPALEGK